MAGSEGGVRGPGPRAGSEGEPGQEGQQGVLRQVEAELGLTGGIRNCLLQDPLPLLGQTRGAAGRGLGRGARGRCPVPSTALATAFAAAGGRARSRLSARPLSLTPGSLAPAAAGSGGAGVPAPDPAPGPREPGRPWARGAGRRGGDRRPGRPVPATSGGSRAPRGPLGHMTRPGEVPSVWLCWDVARVRTHCFCRPALLAPGAGG